MKHWLCRPTDEVWLSPPCVCEEKGRGGGVVYVHQATIAAHSFSCLCRQSGCNTVKEYAACSDKDARETSDARPPQESATKDGSIRGAPRYQVGLGEEAACRDREWQGCCVSCRLKGDVYLGLTSYEDLRFICIGPEQGSGLRKATVGCGAYPRSFLSHY